MLLSGFISLLLVKYFRGRIYKIVVIATIFTVSFLSAFGWIERHQREDFTFKTREYYTVHPVSLSIPFHASVSYDFTVRPLPIDGSKFTYRINLLAIEITRVTSYYPSPLHFWNALAYVSFFLIVNISGAVIGYWLGKLAFVDTSKPNISNDS